MPEVTWLTTQQAIARLEGWSGRRFDKATIGRWIRFGRYGDRLAARAVFARGYRIAVTELERFATAAGLL